MSEMVRAAQYLRMSSNDQTYSIEAQSTAISQYAAANGYLVVRSYEDAGKSGLTIAKREGLRALLADALAPDRGYKAVLVYDVTRWGRFQDLDEAAYYEFLCRQAGLDVIYCAEPFIQDGSFFNAIAKGLKRAMAAEFSRELSGKLVIAKARLARLGHWVGGEPPYGYRRRLVTRDGELAKVMDHGQAKALLDCHVIMVPGPAAEVKAVRRIFRMYAEDELSAGQIAARLSAEGVPPPRLSWTSRYISKLLRNEAYVGVYTYHRRAKRLAGPCIRLPEACWVRIPCPPIVSRALFRKAQARMASREGRRVYSDKSMLEALKVLERRHGGVNGRMAEAASDVPNPLAYKKRFGSFARACELAGCRRIRFTNRVWTDAQLIDWLRELAAREGHIRFKLILAHPTGPSAALFGRRFGSLERACEIAGVPFLERSQWIALTYPATPLPGGPSDAELTRRLKALLAMHGKLTIRIIESDPKLPDLKRLLRHFGSVYRLYAMCGYDPPRRFRGDPVRLALPAPPRAIPPDGGMVAARASGQLQSGLREGEDSSCKA